MILKGANQEAFKWDKEELDYIVEHERNQVRDHKKAKAGTSTNYAIYASYLSSTNAVTRGLGGSGSDVWNAIDREYEDLLRANAGGENGNVSWNFYSTRILTFWHYYTEALSDDPKVAGSLGQIKELESIPKDKGGILKGTFKMAGDRLIEIYKGIPKEWDDLRTIPNTARRKDRPYATAYRFVDPEPRIAAIDKK